MTKGTIKIINQTFLKGTTQQAIEIPESQKKLLKAGEELKCDLLGEANGHYCLNLDNKQWFVSKFHVAFVADAVATGTETFANRIIRTMKTLGYKVFSGDELNIVYIEGINSDGTINNDTPDEWNDLRTIIKVVDGNAQFLGKWRATTEPGNHYTFNPMNSNGAARIAFGQYKAWQVGMHGNSQPHEALVQSGGVVRVHRDLNKDGLRTSDKVYEGYYGINQHWGYNQKKVKRASAGCLVGQETDEHEDFMDKAKSDARYKTNPKYVFWTTVLDGSKL